MAARRFALLLCLVGAPALTGAAPTEDALAVVKKALDAALTIAHAAGTRDENLASLHAIARDVLDTRTMGRRAMGETLAAQPPDQQEAYLALFDELMVRAYLQKLLLFRSPRFSYGEPRPRGGVVIVPTIIATAKDDYHVDYEMREREGRWAATDVVVEGISLTDNYKNQFTSVLQNRTFTELLDLMRNKVRPGPQESK
jgi:phospholipid transport system substrate-binding protein